jgi:hypothetical protein
VGIIDFCSIWKQLCKHYEPWKKILEKNEIAKFGGNMKRKLSGFLKLAVPVLFITALAFVGCSDNPVIGTDNTETGQLNRIFLSPTDFVEVEQLIHARTGGDISVNRAEYEHIFSVEPEAIDQDELITIRSVEEEVDGHNAITFEFGPEGLIFHESATLEIEIGELNESAASAKLYYLDPNINHWVLIDERRVEDGIVSFDIHHFSKYAISD